MVELRRLFRRSDPEGPCVFEDTFTGDIPESSCSFLVIRPLVLTDNAPVMCFFSMRLTGVARFTPLLRLLVAELLSSISIIDAVSAAERAATISAAAPSCPGDIDIHASESLRT